ncbi:peptide chain release factor N(5)-glutamine methyltransferase [Candidatus Saccharibacteria bacterium]|nr:peptide chain release factor N(5)-glutamine methyltransferase [Candidatus Saccharibacteria bacterium]
MTIGEWLSDTSKTIERLDAELILQHFLEVDDRSYLVAHAEDELSDASAIDAQVARRAEGEPLAYILGYREFYGRRFFVTTNVLIPRPETETIINIVKSIGPDRILDVGTGSGCIAVTLSLELPNAHIDAADISEDALRVAQKNAAHHGANIAFHKSDLLSDFQPEPNTLIIANLPYVDADWQWLDHKTLDYEPELALYAEQGGLSLIYKLIDQYPFNAAGLILEADPSQHQAIIDYAKGHNLNLKDQQGYILYLAN